MAESGYFCENLQDNLPCENCRHCRLVARDEFSDLHIIRPEGQTIKTGQIRDLSEVLVSQDLKALRKWSLSLKLKNAQQCGKCFT